MDIRSDLREHLPCPSCVGEMRVYYEEEEEKPRGECEVCGGAVLLICVRYDGEAKLGAGG